MWYFSLLATLELAEEADVVLQRNGDREDIRPEGIIRIRCNGIASIFDLIEGINLFSAALYPDAEFIGDHFHDHRGVAVSELKDIMHCQILDHCRLKPISFTDGDRNPELGVLVLAG